MPSLDLLSTGIEYAFHWLVANYWSPEAERLRSQPITAREDPAGPQPMARDLLECHAYLKIYSLWGTADAAALKR